jgi:hypothetical protein
MNLFNELSAESEMSALAQLSTEEQSEYCNWLDEVAAKVEFAE